MDLGKADGARAGVEVRGIPSEIVSRMICKVLTCLDRMDSTGINEKDNKQGNWLNTGLPGKIAVITVCVCVRYSE